MMSLCIQDWLNDLNWMERGVLYATIRGCDGLPKGDVSKIVVRAFRTTILKAAQKTGSFLGQNQIPIETYEAMKTLTDDLDHYPTHFLLHLMQASEVVGYEHPDEHVRHVWINFYLNLCSAMHLNPEEKYQMRRRLKDDPACVK